MGSPKARIEWLWGARLWAQGGRAGTLLVDAGRPPGLNLRRLKRALHGRALHVRTQILRGRLVSGFVGSFLATARARHAHFTPIARHAHTTPRSGAAALPGLLGGPCVQSPGGADLRHPLPNAQMYAQALSTRISGATHCLPIPRSARPPPGAAARTRRRLCQQGVGASWRALHHEGRQAPWPRTCHWLTGRTAWHWTAQAAPQPCCRQAAASGAGPAAVHLARGGRHPEMALPLLLLLPLLPLVPVPPPWGC